MAQKNYYLGLLREAGFSDYMLRQFRKQQREYEEYMKRAKKINEEVLGNGTTTRSYDYSQLYRLVKSTGLVGRDALNELREEQERQIQAMENYGFTDEIAQTITEAVKFVNQYTENDISADSALRHIAETYTQDELGGIIDELFDFVEWCVKYEESLAEGYETSTGEYLFMRAVQILQG